MSKVQCGNTAGFTGQEYPSGRPLWKADSKFDRVCEKFQIRMRGPGCGPSGLVFYGAECQGEIILVDDGVYPKVSWTITIEER